MVDFSVRSSSSTPLRAGDARRFQLVAALLAAGIALASYLTRNSGAIDPSDEGFLWYGVIETLAGSVPIRDFQSYEPGRYYLCAAWAWLFGDGLLALRGGLSVVMGAGLLAGLLAARRALPSGGAGPLALVPVALLLGLWMFPRHKMFEPALAMAAVYLGVRLLESPRPRQHLVCGLFVGLAAFMGRNHALYAGAGLGSLVLLAAWKDGWSGCSRRFWMFALGVVAGAAPLLVMLLAIPGFAASFAKSLLFFLRHASNISHPVPWPWSLSYAGGPWGEIVTPVSTGLAFLLLPLVYGLGIVTAIVSRRKDLPRRALLIAGATVGACFAHHAFVRSDTMHLAQCIHPLLLALLGLPPALGTNRSRRLGSMAAVLLALVPLIAVPIGNYHRLSFGFRDPGRVLTSVQLRGESVTVPVVWASHLRRLRALVKAHLGPQDTLLIAPDLPGLYAVLARRTPVWGLYFLWRADPESERRMIERMEAGRVDFALIHRRRVAGRMELRFEKSHPLVWKYLRENFAPAGPADPTGATTFLRRRSR